MSEVIKIKEVLKLLRIRPGDITVCSFNEKKGTGGKRIFYKKVMLTGFYDREAQGDANYPPLEEVARGSARDGGGEKPSLDPNFIANATTNIRLQNGNVETIHPCLIESFNGRRVTI
jgi:hypothetical protein